MLKCSALIATLAAGCFINPPNQPPDPIDPSERVEIMTVTPNLDLLFVIDDSGTMADKQGAFQRAFPGLLAQLDGENGLPNLHIGVVSTDLGTKGSADAVPGPGIGQVGQGGCSGTGKNGKLLVNTAPIIPKNAQGDIDPFLAISRDGTSNFSGALDAAFTSLSTLGSTGCGFEQQLGAMRVALDGHPENAGFLRPGANLGVILLTDEDDCSALHSTLYGPEGGALGPQQSFRCFQFGVTCDQSVATLGAKTGCRPATNSVHVEDVAPFASFLAGIKSNPNRVMFGAVIGDPNAVAVESRTVNGQSSPAVAHSCALPDAAAPTLVADPGVRLNAMAASFPGISHVESICSTELGPQANNLGAKLATLVDNTCLPDALPKTADCIVEDTSDFQAGAETLVPCNGPSAPGTTCFTIASDATCSSGQRLEFTRSTPPVTDRVSTLKCAL